MNKRCNNIIGRSKPILSKKMKAIEFACVIEDITKSLEIQMDTDLVAKIFDIYEGSYENYTLLELLYLLREGNHEITVPWNKKAIIEMIEEKNLDIPKKTEPMEPTKWEHCSVRENLEHYRTRECYDEIITPFMVFSDEVYFNNYNNYFIDPYGNIQCLVEICKDTEEDVVLMYFENIETNTQSTMYVEDFIWSIDNEDVTILLEDDLEKYLT